MTLLAVIATARGVELEGPQEVVGLLELGTAVVDLVDEVLGAVDAVGAELAGNDGIVGEGKAAAVDLAVATLVDKLRDSGAGREAVSDEGLDHADHVPGGLVELDKDGVVNLAQSEQLQDLLRLRGKLVDTSDPDEESNLGLSLDEELVLGLGISLVSDELLIGSLVLIEVLLGILHGEISGGLARLGGFGSLSLEGGETLGISGLLLEDGLGDGSLGSFLRHF